MGINGTVLKSNNKTNGNLRGSKSHVNVLREQIFKLLTQDYATPRKVQIALKIGHTVFYRHLRFLIESGRLSKDYQNRNGKNEMGMQGGSLSHFDTPPRSSDDNFVIKWELHGCGWRVQILDGHKSGRYPELVAVTPIKKDVLGSTVSLYRESIVIFYKGAFVADTPEDSIIASWDYLNKVLGVIERDHGLLLMKERATNIRRFKGHFARVGDEIAKAVKGDTIRCYADDGKIRFVVDWSKKTVPELEFMHSSLGAEDASKYEAVVRDIISKESFLPSESTQLVLTLQNMLIAQAKNNEHMSGEVMALVHSLQTLTMQFSMSQEQIKVISEVLKLLLMKEMNK